MKRATTRKWFQLLQHWLYLSAPILDVEGNLKGDVTNGSISRLGYKSRLEHESSDTNIKIR